MDALLLLHLLQELFEPFVHVGIHVCKVGICTNIKSIILTFCTVFVQFLYSCGKKTIQKNICTAVCAVLYKTKNILRN